MRVYAVLVFLLIWIFLIAVCAYARYWRKKAAWALLLYGRNAQWREQREYAARQALLAGDNKEAAKLYALACSERFDKELPLIPFYRKNIKCVFADYYYSKRYHDLIAEDQWNFARVVYQFKEGQDNCSQYFARVFRALNPACELTIMYMPCSTESRYRERFSSLDCFFSKFKDVHSGMDYILFSGERECKHTTRKRDEIDECSNYTVSEAVNGKRVVICDDLLTTGRSLCSYAECLRESGAEVVGAIFLAKTFMVPSDFRIKWVIWKQILFSW